MSVPTGISSSKRTPGLALVGGHNTPTVRSPTTTDGHLMQFLGIDVDDFGVVRSRSGAPPDRLASRSVRGRPLNCTTAMHG